MSKTIGQARLPARLRIRAGDGQIWQGECTACLPTNQGQFRRMAQQIAVKSIHALSQEALLSLFETWPRPKHLPGQNENGT